MPPKLPPRRVPAPLAVRPGRRLIAEPGATLAGRVEYVARSAASASGPVLAPPSSQTRELLAQFKEALPQLLELTDRRSELEAYVATLEGQAMLTAPNAVIVTECFNVLRSILVVMPRRTVVLELLANFSGA